jgi:hypothetical protein
VPSVLSLTGLVEVLLEPPSDRDRLGEEMAEPELVAVDTDRYSDQQWRQVRTVLEEPGPPQRLSAALARVRALDPGLAELVVLRSLHALGTSVATARSQGDERVCLAVDDGAVLRDPEFGGADLLVGLVEVALGEPAAPDERDERDEDVA